ncbi:MAG: AraC family transcriptional regulator [Pseudoxanthomonas sp.]
MLMEPAPIVLSKLPPPLVQRRGEWSLCAMEQSCIDALSIGEPGAPFHHISLPLGSPPEIGFHIDGRRGRFDPGPDRLMVFEACADGKAWWNGVYASACFYFTPQAMQVALGSEVRASLHTRASLHAPVAAQLLRALHADAQAGQPHGALVGDAIFTALAAQFVPGVKMGTGPRDDDWRVRRALEYIHAHLHEALDLPAIASAAATSLFHFSRAFRAAMGCTPWQYVLRERARNAVALMRDHRVSLVQAAQRAGFETYASFIASVKREYGVTPAKLRNGR